MEIEEIRKWQKAWSEKTEAQRIEELSRHKIESKPGEFKGLIEDVFNRGLFDFLNSANRVHN